MGISYVIIAIVNCDSHVDRKKLYRRSGVATIDQNVR